MKTLLIFWSHSYKQMFIWNDRYKWKLFSGGGMPSGGMIVLYGTMILWLMHYDGIYYFMMRILEESDCIWLMIKHDLWCFMVQVLLMVLHGTSFTYGASWYKFCSIKSINSYVFCERVFLTSLLLLFRYTLL